jgi:hypothetical protein
MNLAWTSTPPTEPGWYWLKMRGARSGVIRAEAVQLGIAPPRSMLAGRLAFMQWDSRAGDYWHQEIHMHANCGTPLWAGPIPEPTDPVSATAGGETEK